MHYNVRVYDEMGHIDMRSDYPNGLPKHVESTASEKMKMYTECYGFTHTINGSTFHGRMHRMKPGFQKHWTYDCGGGDRVTIEFSL